MRVCRLYWIRNQSHSDIFSEGYVGITTKSVIKRFQQHLYYSKRSNSHLSNALKKYKDSIVVEEILIGSVEYCLDVESKLRKEKNIGWNSDSGGAVVAKLGGIQKPAVSERISNSLKFRYEQDPTYSARAGGKNLGKKLSDLHRKKIGDSLRGKSCAWDNSNANLRVWETAEELFIEYSKEKLTLKEISESFGFTYENLRTIFDMFKNGWIPSDDDSYRKFKQNLSANGAKDN